MPIFTAVSFREVASIHDTADHETEHSPPAAKAHALRGAGAREYRGLAIDDQAFASGAPETELNSHSTMLLAGGLKNKQGQAILTNDRVLFFDRKYWAPGATLAGVVAAKLQERHAKHGPMIDMPLTDITRVSRGKQMRNTDILVLEAGATRHRFMGGFETWGPLLRRALTERHGRTIVEDGPDAWGPTG